MIFSFAAAPGSAQVPRGAPHRPAAACGTLAEYNHFPQHVVGFYVH